MELTKKQAEGLKIIIDRYKSHEKYTVISGYAGTGKSTLVKFAIEALCASDQDVAYATYTGKAAEVLRKKGNPGACTLHKLLYDSIPRAGGGFIRKPKKFLEVGVVVVDEVSMVPKDMIDMLLGHRVYVIFLGDPFQIPMIDKGQEHDLLANPHIFLDQIMRQAEESEIIRLSMQIRNQQPILLSQGKEVQIYNKEDLSTGMLTWADQVICATNATRQSINNQMRDIYGYSGSPKDGEKMICLRNYWNECNEKGDALVNGTVGILRNPYESFVKLPNWITGPKKLDVIGCNFETEEGCQFNNLNLDANMIRTGEKCIDWKTSYQLGKIRNKVGDLEPREFAFGYAITGHKAQGSQWDKVLVIEERFPFDQNEHARWLYTAITRAASQLVLIRG